MITPPGAETAEAMRWLFQKRRHGKPVACLDIRNVRSIDDFQSCVWNFRLLSQPTNTTSAIDATPPS